jgi:L-amino acid N-acyltransferase YncA
VMHFILPDYRGRKLARLFYEAGIDWARRRKFSRVTVAARESNAPSVGAMRAAGFQQTGRERQTWPDGGTEDELWYEMTL